MRMKGKGKHIGARGSLSSSLARHITALTSLRADVRREREK